MKSLTFNFYLVIVIMIASCLALTSCLNSGQNSVSEISQLDQKKAEAIRTVNEIFENAKCNTGGIRSILKSAKKASANFDTYVYLAQMASEFGYHTVAFVKIARYASTAKVETDYYRQLADLSVMKLSETLSIVDLAKEVSKLRISTSPKLDNKIREMRETANFKTLEEARLYNSKLVN